MGHELFGHECTAALFASFITVRTTEHTLQPPKIFNILSAHPTGKMRSHLLCLIVVGAMVTFLTANIWSSGRTSNFQVVLAEPNQGESHRE